MANMTTPGKKVVDEFYIHLSAIDTIEDAPTKQAIKHAVQSLPPVIAHPPNVAKFNARTGRVSLLSYPDFIDSPFPALAASWVFAAGSSVPTGHRTYTDSLNPPILHRKELLLPSSHPQHDNWARITATAESLGLFDDVATIGFQLNWNRLIHSKGYELAGNQFLPIGNDVSGIADLAEGSVGLIQRHLTALSRTSLSAPVQMLVRHGLLQPGATLFDYGCGRGGDIAALSSGGIVASGWDPHYLPDAPIVPAGIVNLGFVICQCHRRPRRAGRSDYEGLWLSPNRDVHRRHALQRRPSWKALPRWLSHIAKYLPEILLAERAEGLHRAGSTTRRIHGRARRRFRLCKRRNRAAL